MHGRQKYNWEELELEFFLSDYRDAQTFIRERFNIPREKSLSGAMANNIAGWGDRKSEWIRRVTARQLKTAEDNWGKVVEQLVDAKAVAFKLLYERLALSGHLLPTKDIAVIIEKIKTELGEPSNITKQDIPDIPQEPELSEAELSDLKKILWKPKKKSGKPSTNGSAKVARSKD